jgi:O-antigen ligase
VASNNGSSGDTLNSYAWRVVLWQAGLEWMQGAHALFGYGLDSFKFYSPRFFPLEGQDSWDPHNVYVQLVFETGLAGLFCYVWLLTRLLRRLRHGMALDRPGSVILMSIVLAYMLTAYFDNMLYYLAFNWYFWFLAGSACAALRVQRRARLRARAIAQGPTFAFAGAAAPGTGSAP